MNEFNTTSGSPWTTTTARPRPSSGRVFWHPTGLPAIRDINGNVITQSAVGNPYLYTGREYDPESGLYFYRARQYDPVAGRFLQRDPLGYVDGLSAYAYCSSEPASATDPTGLTKFENAFWNMVAAAWEYDEAMDRLEEAEKETSAAEENLAAALAAFEALVDQAFNRYKRLLGNGSRDCIRNALIDAQVDAWLQVVAAQQALANAADREKAAFNAAATAFADYAVARQEWGKLCGESKISALVRAGKAPQFGQPGVTDLYHIYHDGRGYYAAVRDGHLFLLDRVDAWTVYWLHFEYEEKFQVFRYGYLNEYYVVCHETSRRVKNVVYFARYDTDPGRRDPERDGKHVERKGWSYFEPVSGLGGGSGPRLKPGYAPR